MALSFTLPILLYPPTPMTQDDIRSYLEEYHSFDQEQVGLLTERIFDRLDFTLVWQQVEELTEILQDQ